MWSGVSNTITSQASHGETAYGWGNHATNEYATEGYVDSATGTLHTTVSAEIDSDVATLSNALDVVAFDGETDPVFTGSVAGAISPVDTQNWTTAYSGALFTDGSRAMGGNLDLGGNSITNISTNSLIYAGGQSVAQKYVDVAGDTMTGALGLSTGGLTVGSTQLVVLANGNVGIGEANPTNKLAVNGTIKCKEVIVTLDGWSDFVFDDDYKLMPLNKVYEFIQQNGHLPGIPSAEDVASGGVKMGEMQAKLLQKVEELTLHLIALERENRKLKHRLDNKLR